MEMIKTTLVNILALLWLAIFSGLIIIILGFVIRGLISVWSFLPI